MEVFSGYFMTVTPYIYFFCAFTAFVLLLHIYFQRFLKSERGNVGAVYTFYPLSINRVGYFLSINREKNLAVSISFYAY